MCGARDPIAEPPLGVSAEWAVSEACEEIVKALEGT